MPKQCMCCGKTFEDDRIYTYRVGFGKYHYICYPCREKGDRIASDRTYDVNRKRRIEKRTSKR